MKISNVLVSVSFSLAVLAGCSKSGGDPAEKMVVVMEDLGNAIEKAGDDCGKMADAVEGVAKKHDLKALKAEAEKLKADEAQAKKLEEKYGARMQKVMPKLLGMMKCAEDPKMKAVSAKLEGLM